MDELGLRHRPVSVEVEQHNLVRRSDSRFAQQFRAHSSMGTDDLQQQRPDRGTLDAGADVPGQRSVLVVAVIRRTRHGDPAWIGASVVTTTGGTGGYASLALARTADLHRVPDRLGLPEAAALLADGRTAVGVHRAVGIQPGETVVITAAAGGVGSILVQLAKASGAQVIALAGSAAKLDHARSLGADTTVSYRDHDWGNRLRTVAPDGVDVVFDGIGADTTTVLFGLVRPGTRYVQHGAAGGSWGTIDPTTAADKAITVIPLSAIGATPDDLFSLTEHALNVAAKGTIRPIIGQTFPLDDAAAAHAAIESRTTIGKTLLLP